MARNLEWNLNSRPLILCSATGSPLPSHTSFELRKLDSTVLKVKKYHTLLEMWACIIPVVLILLDTKMIWFSQEDRDTLCYSLCTVFRKIQKENLFFV